MTGLTHFDESGASRMVDVGSKPVTERMARASYNVAPRLVPREPCLRFLGLRFRRRRLLLHLEER